MITLENHQLFNDLPQHDRLRLAKIAREQAFPAGKELFREGDPGDGLYLVRDGRVEISVRSGQSGRYIFTEASPGEFVGEMAVLEDQPRSANAVAGKDTAVYFFPRAEFLELLGSSPALALAFLKDASHRLRAFNRQHLREVLQAERLAVVGRFARSIVHDLKNPLNIIGLNAEMAGLERTPEASRERALRTIRQQVDRIGEMVSEILDFTQGTSHEVMLLPPMDFAGFIGDILEELRTEIVLRGSTLELVNPPPSVTLPINPKRLRRLFLNLVHNATEAMPQGGAIFLRFRATPEVVVTEVEDSGPGIAPEIAGSLFEAFATFGKPHGTGLGLSICKKIIEDHKGWIAARNEPGHGAIFEFGIPIPAGSKRVSAATP